MITEQELTGKKVFMDKLDYSNCTCKNCKFWERNKEPESFNNELYLQVNYGLCSNTNFKYDKELTKEDGKCNELLYWDYECYKAEFQTGEDFGCIHFEIKGE